MKKTKPRRKRRYELTKDSSNPHHYMAFEIDWILHDTKTDQRFHVLSGDGFNEDCIQKANISPNGTQIIAKNGHGEIIKRIKIPSLDVLEFLDSVEAGDFVAVKASVEKGMDVNSQDFSKGSALMYAVSNGHLKITRFLIDHGANMEVRTGKGIPLLQIAVTLGNYRIVKLLLDCGCDVNKTNYNKKPALFYAIRQDKPKIADLLRKRGAEEGHQTKRDPKMEMKLQRKKKEI